MKTRTLAALILLSTLFAGAAGCGPSPEQRMVSAQDFMESNNYRGAMIELKSILQENPSDVEARIMLAKVSLGMGDAESADKELTRAFDLGVAKADYLDLYFRVKLALGDFAEVVEQTSSDVWPTGASETLRQVLRGQAFLGLRSMEPAEEAFTKVLGEDPSSIEAVTGLARITASQGSYEQAVASLAAGLENTPAYVRGWHTLGEIHLLMGDKSAATNAFFRAAELARGEPDVSQRASVMASLADVQLANRELELAGKSVAELSGLAPNAFVTRFLAARLAFALGDLQESGTQLQQLLSDYPEAVQVEFLLAMVQAAKGNLGQAEQSLVRVVAVAPDNLMARKMLARVQVQLGRPQQAVELLAPFLEQENSDSEIYAIAGGAKLQAGQHGSAIDYLKQAVATDPGNSALNLDLAAALIAGGRADEGIEILKKVPDEEGVGYRREFLLLLARSKDVDQAQAGKEIDQFLAGHPNDVSALNLVGAYYIARGDGVSARKYLEQALSIDANSIASLVNMVRLEMAEKNLPLAESFLNHLRAVDEGNLLGLQGLAMLAISRGDSEQAVSLLEQARAGHTDAESIRLPLARIYLVQGKVEEAVAVVDELLGLAPEKPEVLAVAGDVTLASGRARDALTFYKRWTDVQPDMAASYFAEARAYLALSEPEAARRALEKATTLRPDWIPASTAMALQELKDGRTSKALEIAERLEETNPENAAPSILKGDIFMRIQEYSKARDAYRRAFELQPGTPIAIRTFQAGVQAGDASPQEGLEKWLEENPEDYAAGIAVAEYYQLEGDNPNAIRAYERVLESRPDDPAALNNLAWALHQGGDPRAEQYARRAYVLRPDISSISDTLGWILVGNGKLQEGIQLIRAAANDAPDNREIQYHLAVGLAEAGKTGESRAILEKLLAEPQNKGWEDDAKRLLDSL